jgi:6-phosphofructokinase 1
MTNGSTLIVGQSGGPTAATNASLAGVIEAARTAGLDRILGMRFGIEGLLGGDMLDLTQQPTSFLERLRVTPSAFLGSCRYKLTDQDLEPALDELRRVKARFLIYIGGNDSADTSRRLDQAARASGLDLAVVGLPKTIDNDLPLTDHCLGYGSAARFIAQSTAEAGLDTQAMRRTDPIKLIEVMGRHSGWLAAAASLARSEDSDAPHLVYLPERPFSAETIVEDVEKVNRRLGYCVVVLSENQPGPDGAVLGAGQEPSWVDAFGHAYHESPAEYLADRIRKQLGVRARVDKPGTLQRVSAAHHSATDLEESEAAGRAAVHLALEGRSGVMVTLVRESDEPYRCRMGTASLEEVANRQRAMPAELIAPDGLGPSASFERYARPLLGGPLSRYATISDFRSQISD